MDTTTRLIIDIELPMPPSLNNAYFTDRRSLRRIPSAEHKAFKDEAGWTLKQSGLEIPPGVPLQVEYWFYFHVAAFARSDADNRVKLVQDILFIVSNNGANDSQIRDIHIHKRLDTSVRIGGYCRVKLEAIENDH